MQLHVPTMLVTTIVSAVLVSAVLPFAGRHRDAPGIPAATVSALCFAASCLLILLKGQIPDAARIVPLALAYQERLHEALGPDERRTFDALSDRLFARAQALRQFPAGARRISILTALA